MCEISCYSFKKNFVFVGSIWELNWLFSDDDVDDDLFFLFFSRVVHIPDANVKLLF